MLKWVCVGFLVMSLGGCASSAKDKSAQYDNFTCEALRDRMRQLDTQSSAVAILEESLNERYFHYDKKDDSVEFRKPARQHRDELDTLRDEVRESYKNRGCA